MYDIFRRPLSISTDVYNASLKVDRLILQNSQKALITFNIHNSKLK